MNEITKKSAELHFKSNPSVDLFYVTKDGQCFQNWHHANEHSKTIGNTAEDREITEVKRSDLEQPKKKEKNA